MSKILSDKDLGDIIHRATYDASVIDCDEYERFLEDVAQLIADHFGGNIGSVSVGEDGIWYIAFHADERVPSDGGIYQEYDRDVPIEEWLMQNVTKTEEETKDGPETKEA